MARSPLLPAALGLLLAPLSLHGQPPVSAATAELERWTASAVAEADNAIAAALSPRYAVTARPGGALWVRDRATATSMRLQHGTEVTAVALGGDLAVFADASGGVFSLPLGADNAAPRRLALVPRERVTALALGGRLAVGYESGGVELWDPSGRERAAAFADHRAPVTGLALRGDLLLSTSVDGTAARRQLDGKAPVRIAVTGSLGGAIGLARGGAFLVAGIGGRLRWLDLESGRVLTEHRVSARPLAVAVGALLLDDGHLLEFDLGPGGPARRAVPLRARTGALYHAALSPGGERLAGFFTDGAVRVFDVEGGALTAVLYGHRGAVTQGTFNRTGERLLTGSSDGTLRIWRLPGGATECVLDAGNPVNAVAWQPGGALVAAGCRDGRIRLFDLRRPDEPRVLAGHTADLKTLAFDPAGELLASGADDARLMLWRVANGERVAVFGEHFRSVHSVAFSPDGKRLASGSLDLTIRIHDVAGGRLLATVGSFARSINTVAWHPRENRLVASSSDGTVRLVDVAADRETAALPPHLLAAIWACYDGDGSHVFSGSTDGELRRVAVPSGALVRRYPDAAGSVVALAADLASDAVATWTEDGRVRLWTPSGVRVRASAAADLAGLGFATGTSNAGERLRWLLRQQTTWHLGGAGGPPAELPAGADPVALAAGADSVAWAEGRRVTTGALTGAPRHHFELPFAPRRLALSRQGTWLVAAGRRGELFATRCDGTGEPWRDTVPANPTAVAIDEAGQRIAAGHADFFLRVLTPAGNAPRLLAGHADRITALAFASDTLLSGSADGTWRRWRPDGTCTSIGAASDHGYTLLDP